jgi:PAS domain S-box-containing protein
VTETVPPVERRREPHVPRPFGRRAGDDVELTERQREVLDLVAEGLENKEIAGRLRISEQAIKQQVSVLLRKYAVTSRAMLARLAITTRILGRPFVGAEIPYDYLFDRAPLLMAMAHGPDHRLVLVNRAFAEFFGERAYVGQPFRDAFPEATEAVHLALDRIRETGRPVREPEVAFAFTRPDGARREASLSFIAEPTRGRAGEVLGIAFYGWDVSEQVSTRRQLQRLSLEQRTLLEELPVGVIYTDEVGRPRLVNGVARRLLRATPDQDRVLFDQMRAWQPQLGSTGKLIERGEGPSARALAGWPFDDVIISRHPDGDELRLHVTARPLSDEHGRSVGALLVLSEAGPAATGGA